MSDQFRETAGAYVCGNFICRAERPWTPAVKARGQIVHPDAAEIGAQRDGYPGGDIVTKRCPHCGHEWDEELPQ